MPTAIEIMASLLVEEVIVDFNLRVGFEVIRQQHDGDWHLI